jgi:hypothetical protein
MTYLQFRVIKETAARHNVPSFRSPVMLALCYALGDSVKIAAKLQGLLLPHSGNDVLLGAASTLLFVVLVTWILAKVQDTLNALWSTTQPQKILRSKFSTAELVFLCLAVPASVLVLCAPLGMNCH